MGNAVCDSPEWKWQQEPRRLTAMQLAKRILEVFPQVEYRRVDKIKIFVSPGTKLNKKDSAVYNFIYKELNVDTATRDGASVQGDAVLSPRTSVGLEKTLREHDHFGNA